jgi:hypothetical protein
LENKDDEGVGRRRRRKLFEIKKNTNKIKGNCLAGGY